MQTDLESTGSTSDREPRAGARLPQRPGRRPAAVLALIAATFVLAACGGSSHSSSTSGGKSSTSGGSTTGGGASTSSSGSAAVGGTPEDGTVVYGSLPSIGTPASGGTLTLGQLNGSTPTNISPIIADLSPGNGAFVNEIFAPLYNSSKGAAPTIDYADSAGNPPRFSDGDRTVTIPLKHGLKWSDGAPVDANDVLFDFALLKAACQESAANWGQYIPGQFPEDITSMRAIGEYTVQLHLNRAYNPGYFLYDQLQDLGGGTYPMPSTAWNIDRAGGPHLSDWEDPAVAKKIYDYLVKAGDDVSGFASNPLWKDVDGPFVLKSFSATNGSYTMTRNPGYGLSPKPAYTTLSVETYTSDTAALNAFRSGTVDVIGLDPSELGEVNTLKSLGASVYGGPSFGWSGGFINFKDTADHFDKVIAQVYVRQAIDHLINQPAIAKGILKGAAVPSYGPVSSEPSSVYTPADSVNAPFPYDPSAAVALLKAHGWKVVPNGQTTCAKAGSGAGECGAGIPAGTPLKFTWATLPEAVSPSVVLSSEAVASIAKQAAGIDMTVVSKTYSFLLQNYNDENSGAGQYTNDWGVSYFGGVGNAFYPTQEGYDGTGATTNFGGYDDAQATKLMNASVYGGQVSAVKREATFFARNPPDFYFPNGDALYAVSGKVGGSVDSWLAPLTTGIITPQAWYLTK